jgi:hypothetical protein
LAKLFMGAPQRQRRSVERYGIAREPESAGQTLWDRSEDCRQVEGADTGFGSSDRPKEPRPTVLTIEEKTVVVAFRRRTLLPLDDCLYALQPTIPHLTRPSLHRCL